MIPGAQSGQTVSPEVKAGRSGSKLGLDEQAGRSGSIQTGESADAFQIQQHVARGVETILGPIG